MAIIALFRGVYSLSEVFETKLAQRCGYAYLKGSNREQSA